MRTKVPFIALLFLCSCGGSSSWNIASLSGDSPVYDYSRLTFISPQAHPNLVFEMIRADDQIEAFISLNRNTFTKRKIRLQFTIDNDTFEEEAGVREGGMRLKIDSSTTNRLIQALKDGQKVVILVDGFEEVLDPQNFSGSFSQFIERGEPLQNFFKGVP